jgi:hypothetical protein
MRRVAAVLPWLVLSVGAALASSSPKPIAVVLDDTAPATVATVKAGLAALGGRVVHAFDDLLIVVVPTGSELQAYRLAGVREVALNGVSRTSRSRGTGPSFGVAAWNAIARGSNEADRRSLGEPDPLADDALMPPAVSLEAVRAASRELTASRRGGHALSVSAATTSGAPYGATELNTSEFLAGAVSVNIILVESDGSIDLQTENWSSERENDAVARIALGLEWVRAQEPQAGLHFVYHVVSGRTDLRARTGYEPIRRAADPTGGTGEDLWVKGVLAKLGYVSGDRFARSRAFASDTRLADGTDWAVNVFVVDSYVDADGRFADGRFAYCWVGGPHLVMTYDNQAWGISRMDMVLRHELLHAFYAFDEYSGSACACTEHRGYLDGLNANCETCNPVAGACVMISNGDAMCAATRRQLGWADLDGDGMIDVVGQDPDTFLDAMPTQVCAAPVLAGLASVTPATNRNTYPGTTHPSISLNHIAGIEYRVDGTSWLHMQLADDAMEMPQERFSAMVPPLAPGSHRLEARAVDDFGNRDLDAGSADVVVLAELAALGDSVRASRSGTGGLAMTWGPCDGATLYRVVRRSSPGGAESVVAETEATSWTDPAAANGYYRVRPVDACGGERLD